MYQKLNISFSYHNNPVVRIILPRGGSQASVRPRDLPQATQLAGGAAGHHAQGCLALPTFPVRPHSPGADFILSAAKNLPWVAGHTEVVTLSQLCADRLKA